MKQLGQEPEQGLIGPSLPCWGGDADLEGIAHQTNQLRPRGTGLDPNAEFQPARNLSDGL